MSKTIKLEKYKYSVKEMRRIVGDQELKATDFVQLSLPTSIEELAKQGLETQNAADADRILSAPTTDNKYWNDQKEAREKANSSIPCGAGNLDVNTAAQSPNPVLEEVFQKVVKESISFENGVQFGYQQCQNEIHDIIDKIHYIRKINGKLVFITKDGVFSYTGKELKQVI